MKWFDLGGGVFFKSIRGAKTSVILGRPGKPGCVAVSGLEEGDSSLRYFDLPPEDVAAMWLGSYAAIAEACRYRTTVSAGESWGLAAAILLQRYLDKNEGQDTW